MGMPQLKMYGCSQKEDVSCCLSPDMIAWPAQGQVTVHLCTLLM